MMDFNERVIPGLTANFLYQEAQARYEFAAKLVKKGMKVLDVGCGTGYGSAILAKRAQVTGVDNSPEAIEFARKKFGAKASFQLGEATKLKFRNQEFGLVCALEVIEHLKDPDKFLEETNRVLKSGGKLILSTPNRAIHSPDGRLSSSYHVKEFTFAELSQILNRHYPVVEIFGQKKSIRARRAIAEFMKSQRSREGLVKMDALGIRKLLPRTLKEKFWQHLGSFFGRAPQDKLASRDFPIGASRVMSSDYFVAVCQK